MQKSKKAKVGRPAMSPDKGKRAAIGLRTTPELKEHLERAATSTGRSLSQEIEFRLEHSVQEDDALRRDFGDERTQRVLRMMANAASLVEDLYGKKWHEDWDAYFAVLSSWQRLSSLHHPRTKSDLLDELEDANNELVQAARALPKMNSAVNMLAEEVLLDALRKEPDLNVRRFLTHTENILEDAPPEQQAELRQRIDALEKIKKLSDRFLGIVERYVERKAAQKETGDKIAFYTSDAAS